MSQVKVAPKVRISQILEKKKREDPIGLITAQREGTMADFLAAELVAAGINPASVVFGGGSQPATPSQASGKTNSFKDSPAPAPAPAPKPVTQKETLLSEAAVDRFKAAEAQQQPSTVKSVGDKFRAPLGGSAKCNICTKSVFEMEKISALGTVWHKQCFTCGGSGDSGCKRLLTQDSFDQFGGQPYCYGCFKKLSSANIARTSGASAPVTFGAPAPAPAPTPAPAPAPVQIPSLAAVPPAEPEVKSGREVNKLAVPEAFRSGNNNNNNSYSSNNNNSGGNDLPADFYGQGTKKPSAADRFRSAPLGGSAKCPLCTKSVFKMEEIFALNTSWHKQCFTCGSTGDLGCKRVLTQDNFDQLEGKPYCRACFGKLVKQNLAKGSTAKQPTSFEAPVSPRDVQSARYTRPAPEQTPAYREVQSVRVTRQPEPEPQQQQQQQQPVEVAKTPEPEPEPEPEQPEPEPVAVVEVVKEPEPEPEPVVVVETKAPEPEPEPVAVVVAPVEPEVVAKVEAAPAPAPVEKKTLSRPPSNTNISSYLPKPVQVVPPPTNNNTAYSYDLNSSSEKKTNAAADKFRTAASTANKCPCCTKTVYKAEELFALNSFWHPMCFNCGGTGDLGCKRRLNKSDFHVDGGSPYCSACFDRIVRSNIQKASVPSVTAATAETTTSANNNNASEPVFPDEEEETGRGSIYERSSLFRQSANTQADRQQPVKTTNTAAADKFRIAASTANKCPCCTKTVYKAEELFALNSFWHPMCFNCGGTGDLGCKRRLNKSDFHNHSGSPYCIACFDRLVKASIQKTTVAPTSPRGNTTDAETTATATTTAAAAAPVSERPASTTYASTRKTELPKCVICSQNVYKLEELTALGGTWHKQCFNCGGATDKGCQRMLSLDSFVERDNTPFCSGCVAKLDAPPAVVETPVVAAAVETPVVAALESIAVQEVAAPAAVEPTVVVPVAEPEVKHYEQPAVQEPVQAQQEQEQEQEQEVVHEEEPEDDIPIVEEPEDDIPGSVDADSAVAASLEENGVTFTDVEFEGKVYRGYHLSYSADFDENGVFYWIGTQGKNQPHQNPHSAGFVKAAMSSKYKGDISNVVARDITKAPNYTDNALNSWVKVDLGANRLLLADSYTIRHGGSSKGNALRNWTLQAKIGEDINDDSGWITLKEHFKDDSISVEPNASASWELDIPEEISDSSAIGFRHFRIVQHGPNSNGNNCLFICGLEFYGVLFEKLSD